MPRSYLSDEPGVRRGHRHKWDAIDQFYSRASTLRDLGHPVDKIEILILGGTWSEYPIPYQVEFIRDIYWSANTFFDGKLDYKSKRKPSSLGEEQRINASRDNKVRIIGLTLETRPDTITVSEIERMRNYGCTRLQIGIQHTNNRILEKINRGCTNEDAIRAVRLLKNSGFKVCQPAIISAYFRSSNCFLISLAVIVTIMTLNFVCVFVDRFPFNARFTWLHSRM